MMYATKIRLRQGCTTPSLTEIDSIFLMAEDRVIGFIKKEELHDILKKYPGTAKVGIAPYPDLVHATSIAGEKYVKSVPDGFLRDNLLSLPKD